MVDIIIRSTVVYLAIIIGLRIAGKRHLGQLSIPDFVLILLVSNAVQNAMVGADDSLTGGLAAAGTLILLNVIVSWFLFHSPWAKRALEGSPVLLIYDGEPVREHLTRQEITDEEMKGVVREHGLNSFADVHTAVLELDGTISIVPRSETTPRRSMYHHRRKTKVQPQP